MKFQRSILILVLALLKAAAMWAVDPATHLSQYAHTAWRVQDGIFSGAPNVITQTVDGYIWVGTENGLFRFNGDRFVLWTPPPQKDKPTSSNILSLYGAHDGSLWIGTSLGLARLKDGVFTLVSGFLGVANSLAEDHNGKMWVAGTRVATLKPLCEISDTTAECHGSGDGFPYPYAAQAVAVDAAGSVWVGSTDTLVHWAHGLASKYTFKGLSSTQTLDGIAAIAGAPNGSLYVGLAVAGRDLGLEQMKNGVVRPFVVPGFDGSSLQVTALLRENFRDDW